MASPPYPPGHVVNERYEILEVVGRGGQGMVYRAFDHWTQQAVAIKVLNSETARQPQMAERMIREQAALSALKGTAAVELLDVCRSSGGELCLVMELLTGVDLDEYLYTIEQRDERLDLYRVVEIFDPIVDTLQTAHDAGILHRDLKPANVFLLEGGAVRLLDFGMARLRNSAPLTAAGTVMGSPSFMAPEAWMGRPELVDHRADVYSLGVILFRVLAGDLPFRGESLQSKFFGATTGERPSLCARRPDLPRDADEWVAQALAIDRDERFRNVRALWNAFLTTLRVSPPRRAGRGRSLWAAAKAAVHRLAGGREQEALAAAPHRSTEPSYNREALARSVMRLTPVSDEFDHSRRQRSARERPRETMAVEDADLVGVPPPLPRERAPGTMPIEKTLELSDSDFVAPEDTVPIDLAYEPARCPTSVRTAVHWQRHDGARARSRRRRTVRARRARDARRRVLRAVRRR